MRDISIDLFCGGGGASLGYELATGLPVSIAINHDHNAIAMHSKNHPDTLHLTEDIFSVDIKQYLKKDDRVRFMWSSPDCTSHSKAKGGQPRLSGLRVLPWAVYKICKQIKIATGYLPEVIIMENVEEIQKWGPLDESGRPIPERVGEDYNKFINAMKKLGFIFDSKELIAADYGAPTTRKRWYAIFRSDGGCIHWPEVTHSQDGSNNLPKWKQIADYLDYSDLGKSIFGRKKPLAEKTQVRISNGIKKFVLENPYIVQDKKAQTFLEEYYQSDYPKRKLKCSAQDIKDGKIASFLTKFYSCGTGQSLTQPIHTITTSPGHFGLVSVFLVKYYGCGTGQSIQAPIDTITTKDRFGLCSVVYEIDGEQYVIYDIFLRMLNPTELKLGQGFTEDYIIDFNYNGKSYNKKEQVARIGNSVVPVIAQALIEANVPYLKKGERLPNLIINDTEQQLRFA